MINHTFKYLIVLIVLFTVSCSENDNTLILNQQTTKTYNLGSNTLGDISGTAKFIKNSDNSITLELELDNTDPLAMHPAHIHFNAAVETGAIALDLGFVDGATGQSSTTFTTLDDGTPIVYEDILDFNGHINIHLSAADLGTVVAQGDIGENALTGISKFYNLDQKNDSGVSGTAQFFQRVNGEALAILELDGTSAGGNHPAHMHTNDAVTTGPIAFTYANVDGETGLSKSNMSQLDDTSTFLYEDVLTYNGHINIHLSVSDLTIVAQGNIGINEGVFIPNTFTYNVINTGATAYNFTGNGLTAEDNPNLTVVRGNTYVFNLNTPGHPFYINTTQGTGTANMYNTGITGNGNTSGTLTFVVPTDAPNTLYYNCEFHAIMTGVITVTD